jgi:hypothetical protein
MKISIIPVDKNVVIDNFGISGLNMDSVPLNIHALQWNGDNGHIEYNDGKPNDDITALPSWSDQPVIEWQNAKYLIDHPPAPTPEELLAKVKDKAQGLLFGCDWSIASDVNITNRDDFINYRQQLRQIYFNPTIDVVFPTEPKAAWSN